MKHHLGRGRHIQFRLAADEKDHGLESLNSYALKMRVPEA